MVWIIGQAFVNIAVVLGLLPVLGVPLPLVSAGGSALITTLAAIGVVLSFARHRPQAARPCARHARPTRGGAAVTVYLLAGGGTAGHVNPLLATADRLRERDPGATVLVLGTAEGLETRLVPERGYELLTVPRLPFPRRPNGDLLRFPGRWRATVRAAREHLRDRRVDVVVGFGGYASAPAYRAARREKVPIAIHEANAKPGLANRLGARFTRFVGVTFASTQLRGGRVVGFPLRREIETPRPAAPRVPRGCGRSASTPRRPVLLVTGGSSGAQRINDTVLASAAGLLGAGWQVLHLSGGLREAVDRSRAAGLPPAGLHRSHGPRLRRRRSGDLAVRLGHRERAGRRRAARGLRAVPGRQRRAGLQRGRRRARRGSGARRRRGVHARVGAGRAAAAARGSGAGRRAGGPDRHRRAPRRRRPDGRPGASRRGTRGGTRLDPRDRAGPDSRRAARPRARALHRHRRLRHERHRAHDARCGHRGQRFRPFGQRVPRQAPRPRGTDLGRPRRRERRGRRHHRLHDRALARQSGVPAGAGPGTDPPASFAGSALALARPAGDHGGRRLTARPPPPG